MVDQEKKDQLFALCEKFIEDNSITCEETVYQVDRVITNAYDLLSDICEIVGYTTYEDDDDDEYDDEDEDED